MACVDACPKHAIKMVVEEDGHFYPHIDKSLCVGCLLCQHLCEKVHKFNYSCNERKSIPYSVYNKNAEVYKRSTSGGVFPAIASYVLLRNGVVYGAAYDEMGRVRHRRITSVDEICLLQGSKYLQSDMAGTYLSIKRDLENELEVLFSGTGCQVAAVLSYFENHKKRHLIYTMDIVCGGVPSLLLLSTFAKHEEPRFLGTSYYRVKEKYEYAYKTEGGKIVVPRKSLPLDGFKSSLTNRYSCYNCKFAGIHRKSDWTIGDLWGRPGADFCLSLCICHSDRAKEILEHKSDLHLEPIQSWDFVMDNPRLVNGMCSFGRRIERRCMTWLFKHCSYRTLRKIYASDVKRTDVLWMIYKFYRLLRFKLYMRHSSLIAKELIK